MTWSESEIYEDGPYCSAWPQLSVLTAEVSDASGVASVKISWETQVNFYDPGGSVELAELTGAGQWSGQMGTFPEYSVTTGETVRVTVTVTATDEIGNSSTAETHLSVVARDACIS